MVVRWNVAYTECLRLHFLPPLSTGRASAIIVVIVLDGSHSRYSVQECGRNLNKECRILHSLGNAIFSDRLFFR